MVTANDVKELRERTGAGMMDCKKALVETNGDIEKAIDYLREKGLAAAAKKAGRIAAEGVVESYIHMGGKIGVLIEVNCETDFVAKTPEFIAFVKDMAMQVARSKSCLRKKRRSGRFGTGKRKGNSSRAGVKRRQARKNCG